MRRLVALETGGSMTRCRDQGRSYHLCRTRRGHSTVLNFQMGRANVDNLNAVPYGVPYGRIQPRACLRTSSLIRWMWPRPRALTSQPSSK